MRAFLIDPVTQTVKEVEYSGDFNQIYDLLGNGCNMFECPITFDNGDTLYCDEEGMYNPNIGGFMYPNWNYPIVGRGLILGCDMETGDSISAVSYLDEIKLGLRFLTDEQCMGRF